MEEQWEVRRIRTKLVYGTRPDRTSFCYPEEEWVTGKGKTLEDAVIAFQTAERINYESFPVAASPKPARLRSYQY